MLFFGARRLRRRDEEDTSSPRWELQSNRWLGMEYMRLERTVKLNQGIPLRNSISGTIGHRRVAAMVRVCLAMCLGSLVSAPTILAQITNVTNDQAVPTPGVGHDYIGTLNEIVNPGNGSLSLRIPLPVPAGRGLTLPISFNYNSSGIIQIRSLVVSGPGGGSNNQTEYSGSVYVSGNLDLGLLEQGGWGFGLPSLIATGISYPGNNTYGGQCPIATGFVFSDSAGTRHAMQLAIPNSLQCQAVGGTVAGAPWTMYTTAYDGDYAAWTNSASNSSDNDIQAMPFVVAGNDGTIYHFPFLSPTGGCGSGLTYCNVPDYIEDRNGNEIKISTTSGNGYPFPITITDSVGRTQSTIPSFQSPTGDQISVSGLSKAFVVNWETIPYNFTIEASSGAPSQICAPVSNVSSSGSMLVVKSIQLPNGQSYQFDYDSLDTGSTSYGLVSQVTYPSGGYVQYKWGPSPQASDSVLYPGIALGSISAATCVATYQAPVVLQRTVSYDGTSTAQKQTFAYTTSFYTNPTPSQVGQWSSKTTSVTTMDAKRSQSFTTKYTYSGFGVPVAADVIGLSGGQVPVESVIQYYDFNAALLKTVTKYWSGFFTPILTEEDTTTPNGLTAGTVYQHDQFHNIIEKAEFDYSKSFPPYYSANGYTTTPTRTTDITYQSFPGRSSLFPNPPIPASPIWDRPCKSVTYAGSSSGTRIAETDTQYDGVTVACGTSGVGTAQAATTPTGTHDETNFGPSSSISRGNASAITRWLSVGTSPQTTFTFDETGQIVSSIEPCSAGCADMTGSNHTTTYSYDSATDTYLTKITYSTPQAGVAESKTFAYDQSTGFLTQSTDQNSQSTTYTYNTPPSSCNYTDGLDRLSEVDYPDGGKTTYCYQDGTYGAGSQTPSVTTSTLLSSGTWKTSIAAMDGMDHVILTGLTSDPNGTDYVATTYDGEGRVATVTNPYRGPSVPANSTIAYSYDSLGRKLLETDQDGNTQQWCYDGVTNWVLTGNCSPQIDPISTAGSVTGTWVDYTDQNGNHWQRDSDFFGRLTEVVEPNGLANSPVMQTSYAYDVLGNLVGGDQYGISGNTARSRKFTYDSLSRLVSSQNPETGTVTYTYDLDGNLSTKSDGRGVVVNYGYDVLSRVLSKTYSGSVTGTATSCYQYDSSSVTNGIGRLSAAWTQSGSSGACSGQMPGLQTLRSMLAYDALGRIRSEQQCIANKCTSGEVPSLSYDYDSAGDLITLGNSVGARGAALNFTYAYDGASRLSSLTSDWAAFPTNLFAVGASNGYNAASQLQNWTQGTNLSVTQGYGPRQWITSISATGQIPQ